MVSQANVFLFQRRGCVGVLRYLLGGAWSFRARHWPMFHDKTFDSHSKQMNLAIFHMWIALENWLSQFTKMAWMKHPKTIVDAHPWWNGISREPRSCSWKGDDSIPKQAWRIARSWFIIWHRRGTRRSYRRAIITSKQDILKIHRLC